MNRDSSSIDMRILMSLKFLSSKLDAWPTLSSGRWDTTFDLIDIYLRGGSCTTMFTPPATWNRGLCSSSIIFTTRKKCGTPLRSQSYQVLTDSLQFSQCKLTVTVDFKIHSPREYKRDVMNLYTSDHWMKCIILCRQTFWSFCFLINDG